MTTSQSAPFSFRFRKPELIPLVFIIVAELTLVSLGVWQLKRLEWKEEVLSLIKASQEMPPLTALPDDLSGVKYRSIEISGTWHEDKTLHAVGGKQGERPGFFHLVPLTLEDGRTILVNRGFVPHEKEAESPTGKAVGILRPARGKHFFFLPDNQPQNNLWITEDIAAMSNYSGFDLEPMVIEATGTVARGVYPLPASGMPALRNDHLSYAVTWFGIAIMGLVLFAFYYRDTGDKA